jgi:hypothetical protein
MGKIIRYLKGYIKNQPLKRRVVNNILFPFFSVVIVNWLIYLSFAEEIRSLRSQNKESLAFVVKRLIVPLEYDLVKIFQVLSEEGAVNKSDTYNFKILRNYHVKEELPSKGREFLQEGFEFYNEEPNILKIKKHTNNKIKILKVDLNDIYRRLEEFKGSIEINDNFIKEEIGIQHQCKKTFGLLKSGEGYVIYGNDIFKFPDNR